MSAAVVLQVGAYFTAGAAGAFQEIRWRGGTAPRPEPYQAVSAGLAIAALLFAATAGAHWEG